MAHEECFLYTMCMIFIPIETSNYVSKLVSQAATIPHFNAVSASAPKLKKFYREFEKTQNFRFRIFIN